MKRLFILILLFSGLVVLTVMSFNKKQCERFQTLTNEEKLHKMSELSNILKNYNVSNERKNSLIEYFMKNNLSDNKIKDYINTLM